MAQERAHVEGQQHPIKLYLVVWGWLFVLSTCSYLVDYFGLHGYLRWSLILLFMVVKAGLIVAVFMHMAWERLALMYAILVPPGAVLLFVAIMAFESDYTHLTRVAFFEMGVLRPRLSGPKRQGLRPKSPIPKWRKSKPSPKATKPCFRVAPPRPKKPSRWLRLVVLIRRELPRSPHVCRSFGGEFFIAAKC
jgi:cytochrome c oxidase subunit IV